MNAQLLLLLHLATCLQFIQLARLPYADLSSLQDLTVTSTYFNGQSLTVYIVAPVDNQTKIVACNFSIIDSIICSSYLVKTSDVIGVLGDDLAIDNNLNIYQLNTSKLLWGPYSVICNRLYDSLNSDMKIGIGSGITLLNYAKKIGITILSQYEIPSTWDALEVSTKMPRLYFISGNRFIIFDYSEKTYLFEYHIGDGLYRIYATNDEKYILVINDTSIMAFQYFTNTYSYFGIINTTINCIADFQIGTLIGQTPNEIIVITTIGEFAIKDHLIIDKPANQCQIYSYKESIAIVSESGITLYNVKTDPERTYFLMNAAFIIPLGLMLLIMGITLLIICLRMRRHPVQKEAMVIAPKLVPLRSDETVVTEEGKKCSMGKYLMNLNMLVECPLTKEYIVDPVVLMDGYTYDRSFISIWLKTNKCSPTTQQELTSTNIISNASLHDFMEEWKKCKD